MGNVSSSEIRVTHVSSAHPPKDVRIYFKECLSLVDAGYHVMLVTPHVGSLDLGPVTHVPTRPSQGRLQRMTFGILRTAVAAWRTGADIYHLHDPELIPVGLLLRAAGKKVIYDAHEDLSAQIRTKPWIPRPFRWLAAQLGRLLELTAGTTMSAVVAATPHIAQRYGGRAYLVQNYPRVTELDPGESATPYVLRSAVVAYVGAISVMRGATQMIEAVGLVEAPAQITFEVAGPFQPPELRGACAALPGWGRVRYRPWASRTEVANILAEARLGIVLFQPAPNHVESYPTKLFEYMAAGLPVIASDFPLWREIVVGGGVGLVVNPENPRAAAVAIEQLLADPVAAREMGDRGRRAVVNSLNWDSQAEALRKVYLAVLGDGPAPAEAGL